MSSGKCVLNILFRIWNGLGIFYEEMLSIKIETVKGIAYLDDGVSGCGGCEAVVPSRTRCWWVDFMECSELVYRKRFPLKV